MAQHEPIVEDRGIRRYKDRHNGSCGKLHCVYGRTWRATIDYFGAGLDVDRESLRGYTELVSLGMEGSCENWRRWRENHGSFERKLMTDYWTFSAYGNGQPPALLGVEKAGNCLAIDRSSGTPGRAGGCHWTRYIATFLLATASLRVCKGEDAKPQADRA